MEKRETKPDENDGVPMEPVGKALLAHVTENARRGDPEHICAVIDKYCWQECNWMMNVGDVKGSIVDAVIREHKPKFCMEFGAYCGYSSIRFGGIIKDTPGARFISVDPNKAANRVQAAMIEFADLEDLVEIHSVTSDVELETLASQGATIDFLFLDHMKDFYLRDLKYALDHGLFRPGSVIVADNVLYPGCPDYREFVVSRTDLFETKVHETTLEYDTRKDEVVVSVYCGK